MQINKKFQLFHRLFLHFLRLLQNLLKTLQPLITWLLIHEILPSFLSMIFTVLSDSSKFGKYDILNYWYYIALEFIAFISFYHLG